MVGKKPIALIVTVLAACASACTVVAPVPNANASLPNTTPAPTLPAIVIGTLPIITVTPYPTWHPFSLPKSTPDPKCVPPCFYGLVPGTTSQEDALVLLKATKYQLDGSTLHWGKGSNHASNFVAFRDGLVSVIVQEPESILKFQDVIQTYGEPETVATTIEGAESPLGYFVLVYPSQGRAFVGSMFVVDKFTPKSSTVVERIVYFAPTSPKLFSVRDANRWAFVNFGEIRSWRGFDKSHDEP